MSKTRKILYWIFTVWLALGLTSTGLVQLLHVEDEVKNFEHLGYPPSLMTILGVWKILAAIALLIPKFLLVKEWAYTGIFFLTTGAIFSYIAVGDLKTDVYVWRRELRLGLELETHFLRFSASPR
jgi:uncharacterized membrane protein YphA (DoxX/SURF4 family)